MTILINQEPWTKFALCAQTDPEAFFPEMGSSTRHAKSVCHRCPVAAECLAYALRNGERYGVWGGYSERERRRLAAGEDVTPSPGAGGGPGNRHLKETA